AGYARKQLTKALIHPRPEIRAAATHALRHFPVPVSVEMALTMLDDGAPIVRDAARQALQRLIRREGTRAELSKWWEGLHPEMREVLVESATGIEEEPPAWLRDP
ncbi:MAG: HEAT repeat domain-containing protein, partial [Planctomycetes bacterium]|nr:HEAT repeat domain-containing protein [Planctomycetota bacterium]